MEIRGVVVVLMGKGALEGVANDGMTNGGGIQIQGSAATQQDIGNKGRLLKYQRLEH